MALVQKKPLGQILLDAGMISAEQLEDALLDQKLTKESLGLILVNKGYVTERAIQDALELQYGLSYFSLKDFTMQPELAGFLTLEQMSKLQVVPISKTDNTVKVGMINPNNLFALDEIRFKAKGLTIQPVVITEDDFYRFITEFSKKAEMAKESDINIEETLTSLDLEVVEEELDSSTIADATRSSDEAPVVKLANQILTTAVIRGVSDIHIQPQERELLLRYRTDGTLKTEQKLPNKIKLGLVSRFKIMANLDISEKRLPQDGRIRIRVKGKGDIDFRVSTLPSKFGEKVVMRILDKSNTTLGLDRLFPFPETLELVREMIDQPYGIVYVTGPTGSGKTTTLYSALTELNKPEWNIVTAEDPIEYDLEGLTQVQIDHKIGKDFATVLRSFLRQDPDIMLVGETRDKETALIGIEAALTGHMVFTSLHTNDAPGAITRLMQMGLDSFLIGSATLGVFAQRLVKRICNSCKMEYRPEQTIIDYFGLEDKPGKPLKFYKGKGCDKCGNTGYKGRIGVYEIMKINDELRDLISKGSTTALLKHAAKKGGMVSLKEYALKLVQEGHTSIDEVRANVLADEEKGDQFCPNCTNPVEEAFARCPYCSYHLKTACRQCDTPLRKEWRACPSCGLPTREEKFMICTGCFADLLPEWDVCPYCDTPVVVKT
jgi:type IV pilus assembly protein PilB